MIKAKKSSVRAKLEQYEKKKAEVQAQSEVLLSLEKELRKKKENYD